MGDWFVSIWIYDILLSCALGAFIGFIARCVPSALSLLYVLSYICTRRKTLKEAHRRQLVDHESLCVTFIFWSRFEIDDEFTVSLMAWD